MAKHTFSQSERFGVWKAFDGRCFWCGEPIDLIHTTVDHLIPEYLESKPDKFAEVKAYYSLPNEFQINDFVNWVPAHNHCNTTKSTTLYKNSPAFIKALSDVAKRSEDARQSAARIARNRRSGDIIARLGSALESGDVSIEEVIELTSAFLPQPVSQLELPHEQGSQSEPPSEPVIYYLSPHWSIVREEGNIVYVQDGNKIGITTTLKDPDPSWICPHCFSYGPWQGNICLSCGARNYSD